MMPSHRAIPGLLAALLLACGGAPEPDREEGTEEVSTIPFAGRSAGGTGLFVSETGDTLRLSSRPVEGGPRLRLVWLRPTPAGNDSIAALIDARTKEPIASYQRRFTADGDSVVARVVYGTGFEGQARLTLTGRGGQATDNLRTPSPLLDAAQIPQTLSALDFSAAPDTIQFNYVAPFEKRTLAARLVLGARDSLRIDGAVVAAWPVRLDVGGLEEVYWYAAAPPDRYRLLRIEESTRGVTWTRVGTAGGREAAAPPR